MSTEPCRLGRVEYDRAQYCHEHGGFRHGGESASRCDVALAALAAAREETER